MELWIHGIDAPLAVRSVRVMDALGALFELVIVVHSRAPDLDLDAAIWAPARLFLVPPWAYDGRAGARSWSGLVQRAEQTAIEPEGLSTYEIQIVPRLFLLTQNKHYRVFTRRTVPYIVKHLLDRHLIDHEWRLDPAAFPALERRVQYGESDYAFILRLCEEAGISFYFEDRADRGSVLVLTDDAASGDRRGPLPFEASPNDADHDDFVTRVSLRREGAPVNIVFQDVDFRRPAFALHGKKEAAETPAAWLSRFYYRPGGFRVDTWHPPASGPAAPPSKGAGRHDPRLGQKLAESLALAEAAQARSVAFETNVLALGPGVVTSIEKHPHPMLADRWLLVTEARLEAEASKEWRMQCRAVWADQPFKPPQKAPRPVVEGIQSAIVVGPPGSELFPDQHGRVKVRFFWEQLEDGEEETSTSWIRVAQIWTGAGFGFCALPRVGQEVAVGFLEGNPDEPVIIGSLPNALTPFPYALPLHASKTVFRTRSTPNSDGYSELSIDDQRGKELFFQRAEGDKETHVKKEARDLVEGSQRRMVGGDEHTAVRGERRDQVQGDEHRFIGGMLRAQVDGGASTVIQGDVHLAITGALYLDAEGGIYLRTAGDVVIEGQDATLRGAGGFVRATQGAALAAPFLENVGAPGVGAASSPQAPSPPVLPAAYRAPMPAPAAVVRLPVLGAQVPWTAMTEGEIICEAICVCKSLADGQAAEGERRKAQICVTQRLRAYDRALNGKSTIKAEVPYDMSQNPPAPIMSRNEPERPTFGKPKGSNIPDVIIIKNPEKPPTQDNIARVIEIKFPPDTLTKDQKLNYPKIAGTAPLEEWGPDRCQCDEKKREPSPARATDVAAAAALAALLVLLVVDDAVGGEADDVFIPGVVQELAKRLGPLLFAP